MSKPDWDVPRTEEGLRNVLLRLERCRAVGDNVEIGNGLLTLSFLVKWVGSDTPAPPFARSRELALEALDLFRLAEDTKGQVRSLVAASAGCDPVMSESLLSEATIIAENLGDDHYVAMVLAARARSMALSDRDGAAELHHRVLEIYRRTGNKRGQAQCLFSLAIGPGSSAIKRDFAVEAAQLYRGVGDRGEASKCVMIALMNAEEIEPLVNLEALVRLGLEDSLESGKRSQEGLFYGKLALIATAKGQFEEASNYKRWVADLQDADGLTPLERWTNDVELAKSIIAMAKAFGQKDAEKSFRQDLRRLKASKPKDQRPQSGLPDKLSSPNSSRVELHSLEL